MLVCAATLFFWAAVTATQILRREYDPLTTRLSEYLTGPWGATLHTAYYALAGAIAVFAWTLHAALPPPRRSRSLVTLLAITALATAVTAAAKPLSPVPYGRPFGLGEAIHVIAAVSAFVSASLALTFAALRLRHLLSRRWARAGLALAAAENIAFLTYFLVPAPWPGARQKLVIVLVTLALFLAAARLARRTPLAPPARGP